MSSVFGAMGVVILRGCVVIDNLAIGIEQHDAKGRAEHFFMQLRRAGLKLPNQPQAPNGYRALVAVRFLDIL